MLTITVQNEAVTVGKEDSKLQKDSQDTLKVIYYKCIKLGYKKEDCCIKKPNQNEGVMQSNSNYIIVATTPSLGKD